MAFGYSGRLSEMVRQDEYFSSQKTSNGTTVVELKAAPSSTKSIYVTGIHVMGGAAAEIVILQDDASTPVEMIQVGSALLVNAEVTIGPLKNTAGQALDFKLASSGGDVEVTVCGFIA